MLKWQWSTEPWTLYKKVRRELLWYWPWYWSQYWPWYWSILKWYWQQYWQRYWPLSWPRYLQDTDLILTTYLHDTNQIQATILTWYGKQHWHDSHDILAIDRTIVNNTFWSDFLKKSPWSLTFPIRVLHWDRSGALWSSIFGEEWCHIWWREIQRSRATLKADCLFVDHIYSSVKK